MNEDTNSALYVYGFTLAGLVPETGVSANLPIAGVDEPHPPFFRRSGAVAAVLSRVLQSDFCGSAGEKNLRDLAWLAPRACRHEAVLEQVLRLGAVLPARFGTLFSSTASLEGFMRQHETAMVRFLQRAHGQEEWALKGFFDQARAEADWLARRRSEEPSPPNSPPGAAYLREQGRRIKAREALDDQLAEACGELWEELSSLVSEIVQRRILVRETPDAAREMVLNWALLLPAAAAADFRGRIERANAEKNRGGLALEVSGPWPPYSFCPVLAAEPVSGGKTEQVSGGAAAPPCRELQSLSGPGGGAGAGRGHNEEGES
jgi:hypothetical protein